MRKKATTGTIAMSDWYSPFVQDLAKEIVVAVLIGGVILFLWKFSKHNG